LEELGKASTFPEQMPDLTRFSISNARFGSLASIRVGEALSLSKEIN
jgi:hypothetical protein